MFDKGLCATGRLSPLPTLAMLAMLAVVALAAGCSDKGSDADVLGDNGGRDSAMGDAGNPLEDLDDDQVLTSVDGYALCEYDADADRLSLEAHPGDPGKGAAAVTGGLALAFRGPFADVRLVALPEDDVPAEPVAVIPGLETLRDPSLAASDDTMLLMWQQLDDAGDDRLWVRSLLDAGTPAAQVGAPLGTAIAGGPAYAGVGRADDFVLAYLAQGEPGVQLVTVDARAAVGDVVTALPGMATGEIAAVALARLERGGILLGWLVPDGDAFSVHAQVLDADLAPTGDAVDLSQHAVSRGPLGMSGRAGSAGLIYQTRELERDAIKFRRVEADGSLGGPLLSIEPAPGRAVDGAIAPFGQGYVVAYRALPSAGHPTTTVRVTFINEFGVVVHVADLADTTEGGGPIVVAATVAGHLVVGWSDEAPSGYTSVEAAKLYCPGALILCGGHLE